MNLTLKDIENVQKQIDELKAKLVKQDKLELLSEGEYLSVLNKTLNYRQAGAIRATKELAEIASKRMIQANKLEAYASVLEPDYVWVEGDRFTSIYYCPKFKEYSTETTDLISIGVPKMSKPTAEKLCELLNNEEINL